MSDLNQAAGQSKLGKRTATERIEMLVDAKSFVEMDKYIERSNAVLGYGDVSAPGEGVKTGWATIDGRPVYVFAQDYAVLKGSMGAAHAAKIMKTFDMAAKQGLPVVCIWDSGGARVQEGAAALDAYARIGKKLADVSGVIPTISVAAGGMLGAAAMFAAMTDFTVAIEDVTEIGVFPPMVLASTAGKKLDGQALIGAKVQAENANASFCCAKEEDAFATVKRLLAFLPSNNLEECPFDVSEDEPARQIAAGPEDARALIADIADNHDFLEVYADTAKEMVTGFAMMNGFAVGFVANAPGEYISAKACLKAARFIRFLDAFDMPVISIVNNNGVEVSLEAAQGCQVRALAKLLYAYAEAGAPMISLITGRAIGEGYAVMSNKGNGADMVYAYPTAEISPVEAEAGGIILFGEKTGAAEYREKFASPMTAAQQGIVDDIIEPANTRQVLIDALDMAANKREPKLPKKHGVMPL